MTPVTQLKIDSGSAQSRQRFCNARTEQPGAVLIGIALAEIAEIPSGSKQRIFVPCPAMTIRSFGSKATTSSMRQAPLSSVRRNKPAIGDSSAETAETAETSDANKGCSNIKRLGGRRRTGSRIAQTAPNCRNSLPRKEPADWHIACGNCGSPLLDCTP